MQLLNEIRRLLVDLAFGRSPAPDYCRHWTVVHQTIVQTHGLAPWFYKSIANHPESCLPAGIEKELRQDYMLSVLTNMTSEPALKQVLGTLNTNNVSPVLLKGAYLGPAVYKDPPLRTMCDIDLLVRKKDFEVTRNTLMSLGYTAEVQTDRPEDQTLQLSGSYARSDGFSVAIDIHRALGAMDFYRFSPSEVWDHVTEQGLYGCKVFFLSPELNFMHVAVHALNHGPMLGDWLDLLLILNRTAFDWDRFICLSRSFGVMRPMWWVFRELGANWESAAPSYIMDALSAYRPHWLEDRIISNRWRYVWRLYAKMRLLEGWRSRIRFLSSRLFPSKSYREALTGTHNWITYFESKLGYFLHFWRER